MTQRNPIANFAEGWLCSSNKAEALGCLVLMPPTYPLVSTAWAPPPPPHAPTSACFGLSEGKGENGREVKESEKPRRKEGGNPEGLAPTQRCTKEGKTLRVCVCVCV